MSNPDPGAFLIRLRAAVARTEVRVSDKAEDEAADDLGFTRRDIAAEVQAMSSLDFERCEDSTTHPGTVIWVFMPEHSTWQVNHERTVPGVRGAREAGTDEASFPAR